MSDSFQGFRFGVIETVVSEADETPQFDLIRVVAQKLSHSLNHAPTQLDALSLIELGSVYVNNERTLNPNRKIKCNDSLRIHASPRRFSKPLNLRERITEENSDFLFVLKPVGLPSEATIDNLNENLISYLMEERHQFLYPIHTIDTESEGLVAFAKSPSAQSLAKQKFASNNVTRELIAFTEDPVQIGVLSATTEVISSQRQVGETSLLTEGAFSWLVEGPPLTTFARSEIRLSGGRPGDVRSLLGQIGNPILGDRTQKSSRLIINAQTLKPSPALVTVRFIF